VPYQKYTEVMKGVKKYVLKNKYTGKIYHFGSEEKRKKGIQLHEAFKHGFKMTNKGK